MVEAQRLKEIRARAKAITDERIEKVSQSKVNPLIETTPSPYYESKTGA